MGWRPIYQVKPDGVVVVAVPPIISAQAMADDMRNQFHVHHIPPAAWHAKLGRFFGSIACHRHTGAGEWADDARMLAEVAAPAKQVTIRETDFDFPHFHPEGIHHPGQHYRDFRLPRAARRTRSGDAGRADACNLARG